MRNKALENRIFTCESITEFSDLALAVFNFQYKYCSVYRDFCNKLGRSEPKSVEEIPFLPISFFKSHDVNCLKYSDSAVFLSSGTTNQARSKHEIPFIEVYERSFLNTYSAQIGSPEEHIVLALLPNYLSQGNSSLVYMVDKLIEKSGNSLSGFYLHDFDTLISTLKKAKTTHKKVVLFGVSYALLDFCDLNPDCSNVLIIETGGMKGRRKELLKEELHALLKEGLNTQLISSEYGMTELLSQAYLNEDGWFYPSSWMKVKIRDLNDPLSFIHSQKTGAINVIDLANLYSCSFIATDDLGVAEQNRFKVLGRVDYSEIRGCNLMVG